MTKKKDFFVSFVIPTYNAGKYLENCLKSVRKQNYPRKNYEILVIDGGSTDNTLGIASRFGVKVLKNPHKDTESGKAIGIGKAKGAIIALVDADNELIQKNWLSEMVRPFIEDQTIFGVESQWTVKKHDSSLNQYFALLRISDPVARRLHPKTKIIEKEGYRVYEVKIGDTPVIGANGFLYRKSFISKIGFGSKFEEVNFIARLVKKGYLRYAVPKNVGIYHHYVRSVYGYIKKRIKIGRKFMARKAKGQNTWVDQAGRKDFMLSVVYNVSIVAPMIESIREYRRSKNVAWFWHPFISFLTIVLYAWIFIFYKLK